MCVCFWLISDSSTWYLFSFYYYDFVCHLTLCSVYTINFTYSVFPPGVFFFVFSRRKMCQHADKNSAYAAIVFRSRQKVNLRAACLGRARSVNTDDDLENGRVGAPHERTRPVQISWRNLWFCRSMYVEHSESRRFGFCFWLRFSHAGDDPTSRQVLIAVSLYFQKRAEIVFPGLWS